MGLAWMRLLQDLVSNDAETDIEGIIPWISKVSIGNSTV